MASALAITCGSQASSTTLNSPLTSPAGSNFVADTGPGPSTIIEQDILDQAELGYRFQPPHVDFADILSVGVGRDDIPPIDNPKFETIEEAKSVMNALEPVVTFKINGEAKAYPLAILTWHEVVNDVVGGVPVTVTFCPLCNSALAFERTLEGRVFDFGVSGNLRNSGLIMWDRQTQTWWQQLTGEAIIGELAGHKLPLIPASIIYWADF